MTAENFIAIKDKTLIHIPVVSTLEYQNFRFGTGKN